MAGSDAQEAVSETEIGTLVGIRVNCWDEQTEQSREVGGRVRIQWALPKGCSSPPLQRALFGSGVVLSRGAGSGLYTPMLVISETLRTQHHLQAALSIRGWGATRESLHSSKEGHIAVCTAGRKQRIPLSLGGLICQQCLASAPAQCRCVRVLAITIIKDFDLPLVKGP